MLYLSNAPLTNCPFPFEIVVTVACVGEICKMMRFCLWIVTFSSFLGCNTTSQGHVQTMQYQQLGTLPGLW